MWVRILWNPAGSSFPLLSGLLKDQPCPKHLFCCSAPCFHVQLFQAKLKCLELVHPFTCAVLCSALESRNLMVLDPLFFLFVFVFPEHNHCGKNGARPHGPDA